MKTTEFDYDLPHELIAQYPPKRRGGARLLVLDRKTGAIEHRKYLDIPEYLHKDDIVVLNRTKVMKARVFLSVVRSGKTVEVLFLEHMKSTDDGSEEWSCLIGRAKNVRIGDVLASKTGEKITVLERIEHDPRFIVSGTDIVHMMDVYGRIPLPPYIKRSASSTDEQRYNTVFGSSLHSAASPTASLNLTEGLLEKIRNSCAAVCTVDLHIGLGTFRPIDTDEIESYSIHAEYIQVPQRTVDIVNSCKGRVWAFGTTVVRALESVADSHHRIHPFEGETKLYIYPGFSFKVVDVLVTNFHMSRTSLIALVSAFAGKESIRRAYENAIKEKYHFLSYGDSMLIGDWGSNFR